MKSIYAILTVTVLSLCLSCAEDAPYVIGFTSSLSGTNSDLGVASRNGVLLAVEELNEKGGLNGRDIEVMIKDHQMDAGQLSHIGGAFNEASVEIVIGPLTSGMTKAMLPIAVAMDLIILSPTASSRDFISLDDNLIRLNSSTLDNTRYYADYMIDTAQLKSCGILYDSQNESFTSSWVNDFTLNYEGSGGDILVAKEFNSKIDTNFSSELDLVLSSGAEALLIIANSIDSATIIQQLRQVDKALPVVVAEWAGTRQLIELGGRAVEGVLVLQSFDPFDESESYMSFRNKYSERFQSNPTFASVLSYDACMVVYKALISRTENQSIKAAVIENGPYEGVQETIDINKYGDVRRTAVFSVVKNGQFRKVE